MKKGTILPLLDANGVEITDGVLVEYRQTGKGFDGHDFDIRSRRNVVRDDAYGHSNGQIVFCYRFGTVKLCFTADTRIISADRITTYTVVAD